MTTHTLGERIDLARTAQGFTLTQLASRMGVLTKTINSWQKDHSEPRANKLLTLAGVLNVSVMWLMTGKKSDVDGNIATSEIESSLSSKMARLLSLHQESSTLLQEINRGINRS